MKPGIHPDYHPVVFQDATTGALFLPRCSITSSRIIEWDTPWTGKRRTLDAGGRMERFYRRYGGKTP
jgi:large subunit ribosomal protein L31